MTSQWARWSFKSPASRLFTQPFIQERIKEKHQRSASLAFVRGIHRWPVNSPHKWPVTRKMFPFDDVIMLDVDQQAGGAYLISDATTTNTTSYESCETELIILLRNDTEIWRMHIYMCVFMWVYVCSSTCSQSYQQAQWWLKTLLSSYI